MPLETGTFVNDLDAANPLGSDDRSQGDNHLRTIKSMLKATFPNASKAFRFPTSGAMKTSNFSVVFPTDQNVLFAVDSTAGGVTVSLPDPTSGGTPNEDGFGFWIIRAAGGNNVILSATGGHTIHGNSSYTLLTNRHYAYVMWAGTINTWYVFDGNNPLITYALEIALATNTPLILRRTENDAVERDIVSYRSGSGAGNALRRTITGGGANNVARTDLLIGSTRIDELAATYRKIHVPLFIGSSGLLAFDILGFADLTEIATPANPAVNVGRLYAKDDSSVTRLAYRDSAGTEALLLGPRARAYAEYATNVDISTSIPFDDTPPTNLEGTEILSANIILGRANSRVRATFQGWGGSSERWAAAIFRGATCIQAGAIGINDTDVSNDDELYQLILEVEEAPGSVGPHTYSVRVGPDGGTLRLNGTLGSRMFGGASKATLVLEEIPV